MNYSLSEFGGNLLKKSVEDNLYPVLTSITIGYLSLPLNLFSSSRVKLLFTSSFNRNNLPVGLLFFGKPGRHELLMFRRVILLIYFYCVVIEKMVDGLKVQTAKFYINCFKSNDF